MTAKRACFLKHGNKLQEQERFTIQVPENKQKNRQTRRQNRHLHKHCSSSCLQLLGIWIKTVRLALLVSLQVISIKASLTQVTECWCTSPATSSCIKFETSSMQQQAPSYSSSSSGPALHWETAANNSHLQQIQTDFKALSEILAARHVS